MVWSILKSQLFIYYHSGQYYQRHLTNYREFITINKNFPPLGFLVFPYITHDAFCVILSIDWTSLIIRSLSNVDIAVDLSVTHNP